MQNTKLTLNIQDKVIHQAKAYAKAHHISLSKIVEHYLATLGEREASEGEVSAWTRELAAVKKPTPDFNHKEGYRLHMMEKYTNK